LDLISQSEVHLALIVGSNDSGCSWAEAALTAAELSGVPLKIVVMRPGKMNETKGFSVQKWAFAIECRVIHAEIDEGWWQLCGVPAVGAILVRPDEHVAWRATTAPDSSSVQQLHYVFTKVFPVAASLSYVIKSHTSKEMN
jgi:hypothetical protein